MIKIIDNTKRKSIIRRMGKIFKGNQKTKYENAITSIQDYVETLEDARDSLRDKLDTYNRNEELSKLRDDLYEAKRNSLLQLNATERERLADFKHKHYKECGNSGDFEYRVTGTGVGSIIKVKCTKCMDIEDITDFESW